jgi:hypothetical protein
MGTPPHLFSVARRACLTDFKADLRLGTQGKRRTRHFTDRLI